MLIVLGLQKISQCRECDLTPEEQVKVERLLLPNADEMLIDPLSFAQSLLDQESQKYAKAAQSKYRNVDFIPPGSVIVESLFSIVGHMFHERRASTTPVHVEEQVFLRMNNSLWNAHTLTTIENLNAILEETINNNNNNNVSDVQ